jgi:N-acetyl-anhydromuramyl-L-alanine amidase AmpD
VKTIVIHCADTPASMDIGVKEIRDWHMNERGWSDIGYHFVIRRNGRVEAGRSLEYDGAHVFGHNDDTLSICLVGGKGGFNFTMAQMGSLSGLIHRLTTQFPTVREIIGHRDLDPGKECPQFDVRAMFNYKENVNAR